jgi:error-prone DNA polymerase
MRLAVVAAGFAPGEADELRRVMTHRRSHERIQAMKARLLAGMAERGISAADAEIIFNQLLGFAGYGFPESHSASFALLVYASAWLKRYHPAAFACALLNSQPMGFYSASSIVQDARRHGVPMRPVDVQVSEVDCTLENKWGQTPLSLSSDLTTSGVSTKVGSDPTYFPALRLGLSMVKGLKLDAAQRVVAARAAGPFVSTEDLARRAKLDRGDLSALAAADALATLAGHRREALWETLAVDAATRLEMPAVHVPPPPLRAPTEGEEIVGDYGTLGLTLRRHPLALLREKLAKKRMRTATEIANARHGQFIRTAGIVTCRQRPATASGVIFVTLEDETGHVNLVVWSDLAERQRRELLGSKLLAVSGQVQREGLVVHVLARRLEDLSPMLGRLATASHDFH